MVKHAFETTVARWLRRIRRGVLLQFGVIVAALICLALVQCAEFAADRIVEDARAVDAEFWKAMKPADGKVGRPQQPQPIAIDAKKVDLEALKAANAKGDAAYRKLQWIAVAVFVVVVTCVGLLVVMARAVYLITAPAPTGFLFIDRQRLRMFVRCAMLAGFLIVPLAVLAPEHRGLVQTAAAGVSSLVYVGIVASLRDVAVRFGEIELARRTTSALTLTRRVIWIVAAILVSEAFFGPLIILAVLSRLALLAAAVIVISSFLALLWQYRGFLTRQLNEWATA